MLRTGPLARTRPLLTYFSNPNSRARRLFPFPNILGNKGQQVSLNFDIRTQSIFAGRWANADTPYEKAHSFYSGPRWLMVRALMYFWCGMGLLALLHLADRFLTICMYPEGSLPYALNSWWSKIFYYCIPNEAKPDPVGMMQLIRQARMERPMSNMWAIDFFTYKVRPLPIEMKAPLN